MELKGTRGLFVKPHVGCSHRFPSFGRFARVRGLFWAKNACFWPKTAHIWRQRPGPPPVSFWLKTWISQDHHLGSGMANVGSGPKRWEGAMAKTKW